MFLAQDTVLLFTVLRTLDRSFNLGPLETLLLTHGEQQTWTHLQAEKKIRAHIVVLILSNWSHFYYSWKELTNLWCSLQMSHLAGNDLYLRGFPVRHANPL